MNLRAAQNLQPHLRCIIHQEQRHAVVVPEIADADVLLVAPQIGEAQRLIVDDAQKTLLPAAILDIWPSRLAHRGPIKAVARGDKLLLARPQPVSWIGRLLYALV